MGDEDQPTTDEIARREAHRLMALNLKGALMRKSLGVGDVIGGWRLDTELGKGGFGEVYAAHKVGVEELRSAIKLLHERHLGDASTRERFVQEAQAMTQVRGEHLVEIHDVQTTDDGRPYLVMELLEGGSLADRIGGEGVSLDELWSIGAQLLDGLRRVHEAGMVHRDIKPENIFVCDEPPGRVKLLDFGLAKTARRLTETGTMLGTTGYIAPEIAQGEVATPRSDLYGVAVVLCELLADRRIQALRASNGARGLPLPAAVRQRLPAALCALLERGLAVDPQERFSDAAQMKAELGEALGRDVQSDGPSTMRQAVMNRLQVPGRRRRERLWALTALVVPLMVTIAAWWPGAPAGFAPDEGGILVTRSNWAGEEASAAYQALCDALRKQQAQRLECSTISWWSSRRGLQELAEQTNAVLVIHVEAQAVRLAVGGRWPSMPVLKELSGLRLRTIDDEVAAAVAPIMSGVVELARGTELSRGSLVSPGRYEDWVSLIGHDTATLAELLAVLAGEVLRMSETDRRLHRARLHYLRNACEETDGFYCAVAHILYERSRGCEERDDDESLLELAEDMPQAVGSFARHAWIKCAGSNPSYRVRAAEELRSEISHDPEGSSCERIALMSLVADFLEDRPRKTLSDDELELYEWIRVPFDIEERYGWCPPSLRAFASAGRGRHYLYHEDYSDAVREFDYAVEKMPSDCNFVANWAEAAVMEVETSNDPSKRRKEFRERFSARIRYDPDDDDACWGTYAVWLPYLLWMGTGELQDAQRMLQSYDEVTEGNRALPDGLQSSLGELCKEERDCVYHLLEERKTPEVRQRLVRALGQSAP